MVSKICFKCRTDRPLTDYYKHPQMGDGHLNKCKDCTKRDVKLREGLLRKNPEWVEKEKERAREKYYRLGYKSKHKPYDQNRREVMKRYLEKYPEKRKASMASRGLGCSVKEAHHWSYRECHWKDIILLTPKDHAFLHRYIEYDQERYMYRCTREIGTFIPGDLLDTKYRHIKYFLYCKKEIQKV